jgi:hypothetical protein
MEVRCILQRVHTLAIGSWFRVTYLHACCILHCVTSFTYSTIQRRCQLYREEFGEAPKISTIAKFAGDLQHKYTLQGNARPFGKC